MINIFLEKIIKWSTNQKKILKVYLVGSHANNTAKYDSDIDIILLTDDPDFYIKNKNWIYEFGNVKNIKIEYYGKVTSLRVWYKNSFEIEFGITNNSWDKYPLDLGTEQVLKKGYKILYIKK
jgi:predicted nucleotidyltransferase